MPSSGPEVRGIRVNEDVFWIHIRDAAGAVHTLQKSDLKDMVREIDASLMPSYSERLKGAETHPGIRYLAALAALPTSHPFARQKEGRGHWSRSPWERLSVAKSLEIIRSAGQMSAAEMTAANFWAAMKLAEDVIVVPDHLLKEGISSVDFLKIDVDGADFDILNSFDRALDTLAVIGVGIEVNYFGSASGADHTFHNVDRFMKARGFEPAPLLLAPMSR